MARADRGPNLLEVPVDTILALQSLANPLLDALALALTNLGSEEAYVAFLVVVYLSIDAKVGRWLGLTLLGSFYVNQVLKDVFGTVRPYLQYPELLLGGEAAADTAPGPAFPSGHAQSATTFWGFAAMVAGRRWFWVLAIFLIVTIGATRLYLGVHWPVDVVGGTAVGALIVYGAYRLWRNPPRLSPAAQAALFVVVPLALHLLYTTPESGTIAGAFIAFGTAPLLFRHQPHGSVWRRAVTAVFGLALAFAFLLGSSVALPSEAKDHLLVQPTRYLALGWVGTLLAPWAALRLGLMPRPAEPRD